MEWEGSILRKFDANEGNCVDAKPVFPLSLSLPPSLPLASLFLLFSFSASLVFFLEEGNTRLREEGVTNFSLVFRLQGVLLSSLISTSSFPNIDKQSEDSGCCHWNPHGIILNFVVKYLRRWTILIQTIDRVYFFQCNRENNSNKSH